MYGRRSSADDNQSQLLRAISNGALSIALWRDPSARYCGAGCTVVGGCEATNRHSQLTAILVTGVRPLLLNR